MKVRAEIVIKTTIMESPTITMMKFKFQEAPMQLLKKKIQLLIHR